MRAALIISMLANAALFTFGALEHAGMALGPFAEPVILPATIVESLCALALLGASAAVWARARSARRAVLIGNAVAIAGVAMGMAALAAGAAPRTASNDVSHGFMLAFAITAIIVAYLPGGVPRSPMEPR